uniref:hypothetical protein n=1 Tax=Micrococcus luteus TaxID=1270 RepID=UPI002163CCDF
MTLILRELRAPPNPGRFRLNPPAPCDELGATAQAGLFHRHHHCAHCGGAVRIVASIEEPTAIRAILAHFEKHGALEQAHYRPAARAPPPAA